MAALVCRFRSSLCHSGLIIRYREAFQSYSFNLVEKVHRAYYHHCKMRLPFGNLCANHCRMVFALCEQSKSHAFCLAEKLQETRCDGKQVLLMTLDASGVFRQKSLQSCSYTFACLFAVLSVAGGGFEIMQVYAWLYAFRVAKKSNIQPRAHSSAESVSRVLNSP